ncbi:MAG: type IV toxin-antitoxin system AbiEi family antitoxin [Ferruginibacter sp.]
MNENEIIHGALERLAEQTGMQGRWNPTGSEPDGELDLYMPGKDLHLFVEVKKELRQYMLPNIFEMAKKYQPLMIVATNIFPTLKEMLREKKIGYLDTAGNIYAQTGTNFIWIDGNKPIKEKNTVKNRAFTKTGLKTVFYLLLNKDAINMPHRKLAEATGVALGNIKNVIEGLKEAGFILKVNDTTIKLQEKKALLDRWITGYRETLKPTLLLGRYRFWDRDKLKNWQTLPIQIGEDTWGGEPAAEYFTNYLMPTTLTLYTERKAALLTKWTLIPDEKGDVHFYKKFWKDEINNLKEYAPPLLVYADLMMTDDPRCQETARMIYNKFLIDEFK